MRRAQVRLCRGGSQGIAIVDVEKPSAPKLVETFDADGQLNDARAIRVLQLTSPTGSSGHFGFSPRPQPRLIASAPTKGTAIALSKGLDRDRAVDESGNQIAVFGRRGGRPMTGEEMRRLYFRNGEIYTVTDFAPDDGNELAFQTVAAGAAPPPEGVERVRRGEPVIEPPDVGLPEQPGFRLRKKPGVRLREVPGLRLQDDR